MASYLTRKYQCPECGGEFVHTHEIWSKREISPPPDYCPLCGKYVGPKKAKKKLKPPRPRNTETGGRSRARILIKSENQVYRQMEETSVNRMEQAAEMLGMSAGKLSNMKTTNMKDNVKAGESSYIPPSSLPAPDIKGQETKMTFATGEQIKSGFGGQLMPGQGSLTSGQANRDLQNAMSATLSGHQNRVQATVAAGIKK